MRSQPGLFSRSTRLFGERPGLYLGVASLPYFTLHPALWWAMFQFLPVRRDDSENLRAVWAAMSSADKFESLALTFLSLTLPFAVASFGLCRVASNQIGNCPPIFGKVALGMARFLPSALLLSILFGASIFLGMCFLLLPAFIVASAFSLVVPAASIERLGPFSALRRGFSLMTGDFPRLLVCFLLYSLVVGCAMIVQGIALSLLPHTAAARIPIMATIVLALLVPLAIFQISLACIFYDAREKLSA